MVMLVRSMGYGIPLHRSTVFVAQDYCFGFRIDNHHDRIQSPARKKAEFLAERLIIRGE